jgi:hypothetical protein
MTGCRLSLTEFQVLVRRCFSLNARAAELILGAMLSLYMRTLLWEFGVGGLETQPASSKLVSKFEVGSLSCHRTFVPVRT